MAASGTIIVESEAGRIEVDLGVPGSGSATVRMFRAGVDLPVLESIASLRALLAWPSTARDAIESALRGIGGSLSAAA